MSEEEQIDFTIVTPSFNYAKYVKECIESVLTQEGVTFEHIVQDAGSTDGTLEILRSYPHLKLFVESDSGMSEGINRGFRKARGKWVMWLNTDDRLLPGALAAVKEFAEKHPEADIIHGAWNFVNPDGSIQRPMKALPFSTRMHIWYGTYVASTALFLRRETTIDQGILLDERFRYDMDGEFYARLGLAKKKFVHFNKLLADFRWHGDNLSAPNLEQTDMTAELKRQAQHREDAAIKRVYGYSFSKHSLNNILDGILREVYRMKKAVLYFTTPWEK